MKAKSASGKWQFFLVLMVNLGVAIATPIQITLAKTLLAQTPNVTPTDSSNPELTEVDKLNQQVIELYQQGQYSDAIPLAQRALAIYEKALGSNHPDVATSLNNLAKLYRDRGNYAAAEPLYQRALVINEKALGSNHPNVALSLNNLAALYSAQGNYAAAEPLYQRALTIREKTLGSNHPDVAQSLNNLAELYRIQGNYAAAEPLYQRSLTVLEKALGSNHPNVALSLNNLAVLYSAQGNYAAAEPLYQRALTIREKALGSNHPDVAQSLNNLAVLYSAQDKIPLALELLNRATNIEENNLELNLAIGSESQKQAYIATISGTTNATVSLHIQSAPDNPTAARLALTTILRRKGRVLDAMTDSLSTLRQNLTPEDQKLLDELATKRSQLASLIFKGAGDMPAEQYKTQVATIKRQAEDLEAALALRSSEFRTQTEPVTIEAIQKLIPADAALIELVQYYPYNAKNNQWEKPRYVAYILHSQGEPTWVDLGEVESINQSITDLRRLLKDPNTDVQKVTRTLDQQLMQPIRPLLGNKRQILLSPDSQLNLIPFAALVDEENRYLVENYTITYLTTGRDLLRLQNTSAAQENPVLIANPDYDKAGNTVVADGSRGNQSKRSSDIAQLQYDALAGTAKEAEALKTILPGATILTQLQATENALKQVKAPKILHIATHGFFLEDVELVAPTDYSFGDRGISVQPIEGIPETPKTQNPENPLLRSGIALAGFNQRSSGNEDGLLTALEASGLNFYGTKLVVLSACETGLGDVKNGEGVYGLRRAFVMAGAESQVMSLWKVDDTGTKDLMVSYYNRLMKNEGRSEALRQTQLAMLRSQNYQHPYYWGAFLPIGDWRAMD